MAKFMMIVVIKKVFFFFFLRRSSLEIEESALIWIPNQGKAGIGCLMKANLRLTHRAFRLFYGHQAFKRTFDIMMWVRNHLSRYEDGQKGK